MQQKEKNKIAKEVKLRAKYKCPDNLGRLIDWANRFPDTNSLPEMEGISDFFELVEKKHPNLKPDSPDFSRKEVEELFNSDFGRLNAEFLFLILRESLTYNDIKPPQNWQEALDVPDVVSEFVYLYSRNREAIKHTIEAARVLNEARKNKEIKPTFPHISTPTFLTINQENKIVTRNFDFFFDAIRNVEADRIRLCEICSNIFWAKNNKSLTCSKKCLNALRQRRFRDKNKDEINEKRRANYPIRKMLNKNKGGIN